MLACGGVPSTELTGGMLHLDGTIASGDDAKMTKPPDPHRRAVKATIQFSRTTAFVGDSSGRFLGKTDPSQQRLDGYPKRHG